LSCLGLDLGVELPRPEAHPAGTRSTTGFLVCSPGLPRTNSPKFRRSALSCCLDCDKKDRHEMAPRWVAALSPLRVLHCMAPETILAELITRSRTSALLGDDVGSCPRSRRPEEIPPMPGAKRVWQVGRRRSLRNACGRDVAGCVRAIAGWRSGFDPWSSLRLPSGSCLYNLVVGCTWPRSPDRASSTASTGTLFGRRGGGALEARAPPAMEVSASTADGAKKSRSPRFPTAGRVSAGDVPFVVEEVAREVHSGDEPAAAWPTGRACAAPGALDTRRMRERY